MVDKLSPVCGKVCQILQTGDGGVVIEYGVADEPCTR